MNEVGLPLSALQHWCYCPRQCWLIRAEQAFAENVHSLRGQSVHSRVDDIARLQKTGERDRPPVRLRTARRVVAPVILEQLLEILDCD